MSTKWDNDEVIQRFREYLKIPSVHPDIDYTDCVKYFINQANELDLPVMVYELVPKKPVVVITWTGLEPKLPSILLNSHMDVVPVFEECWTYPPFDAEISEDGFIYARGSQDTKCTAMMNLEAIRRLMNNGVRLKRTVHVSLVPDEEIGGLEGMGAFTASEEFKHLNIGFEIDESVVNPDPKEIIIFRAERTSRQIKVTCHGIPGHGSRMQPSSGDRTAGEKINYIISKFMAYRAQEQAKLDKGAFIGDVTTINLTQLEGGVQINVLPESLSVSFDIRIAIDVDHDEFENMITKWCQEAGDNVTFEYYVKNPQVKATELNDDLVYWAALHKTVEDMGLKLKIVTCPGATDARYIRQQGIPAIGFTPITNTQNLLHANNERLHVDAYKKGIDVMEKVIQAIANA